MENRGPELTAVSIAFLTVTWLVVGLRLYIRRWIIKALGMDDWLMVITLVLFTLNIVSILVGVSHGIGKHERDLTAKQQTAALEAWWFSETTYILNTCALKIAIGSFLLRVVSNKIQKYIIYGVTAVSTLYCTYGVFLIIFQCQPVSYFWDRTQHGHCLSRAILTNSTYAYSAISALSDWTFGIIPIFIVHDLQMRRSVKISIAALLCFANIGSIATLLRIQYIKQLDATSDFLFATVNISIWSIVEPGVGIIAGSLATYRPLLRAIFAKTRFLKSNSCHANPTTHQRGFGDRTSALVRIQTPPEFNPSSSILNTKKGPPSKATKKHHDWSQRYEMDENLERGKSFTQITSSETQSE